MDKDIKELQMIWQQQKSENQNLDDLILKLNQMEKKSRVERLMMTAIFPITIIIVFFAFPTMSSWYYIIGVSFIAFAMLMLLFLVYKNRFESASQLKQTSNIPFIENQIQKLKDKIKITSFYMWVYIILLIIGINVCYLEALSTLHINYRLIAHLAISALLLIVMFFGIKLKLKEYQTNLIPLIDQLNSLK